jgi:N-acetylglucosamine-6-phosphate deacetylase
VNPVPSTILLRNCRAVLRDRIAQTASLFIESGRIARIIEPDSNPPGKADSVLDLDGLTIYPGFIDVHIHGAAGVDTMEASPADLQQVSEFLARHGVTGWMPTLVPATTPNYQQAVNAISGLIDKQASESAAGTLKADQMPSLQARALGVHYEGPFVNSEQCGALHRQYFRTFNDAADLDSLPAIRDGSAVHLMTLAPEIAGGIELIKDLKRRGWVVSIGHTRATVDVLDQAFVAGARHMTHFMNAMTPLHHRAPGPVGWGLINDEVTCDVIADGIHLNPEILKLILRSKTADRVSLISDAIAPTGLGDGEYHLWDETISVKDGRTQNVHGSIAGSVITMLDAVRMMLSLGFSESAIARMASLNPARLLGIDHECGSIEEGKRADLVALDQDGERKLTFIGGAFKDK